MDWTIAIERNREALKRILSSLLAMAGLVDADLGFPSSSRGGARGRGTLPRHLHRAVLRLLRPAEAAARRLIIVMARGLVVKLPLSRLRKPKDLGPTSLILRNGVGTGILMPPNALAASVRSAQRTLSLPLLDPLRQPFRRRPAQSGVPRISMPGFSKPFLIAIRPPVSPHDPISTARLALRLKALASALDDLPAQARRFARWKAQREIANAKSQERRQPAFRRVWPLRPGHPPGWRRRPTHEVHELLSELHGLAFSTLESPDTS